MITVTIQFDVDNTAFWSERGSDQDEQDFNRNELRNVLTRVATRMAVDVNGTEEGLVLDSNGNRIGEWIVS